MVSVLCFLLLFHGVLPDNSYRPKSSSSEARETFARAQRALTDKDYVTAERCFREVINLDPRSAAAYSDLGAVYLRTHRVASAIHSFEAARRLAPREIGIDLNLGLAYYHQHSFRKAITQFKQFLAAYPENNRARYLEALCYFALRDYKHTVETLAPLSATEHRNIDFLFIEGISYGKLNQKKESKIAFDKMVRVGGQSPMLHLLLARLYIDSYYDRGALMELNKAIAEEPDLPFAHYDRGVVYQRLGLLKKAAEEYGREITISPRRPWSYEKFGEIRLEEGNYEKAVPLFRRALSIYSRLPASWAGLGRAYSAEKQFDKAISCYHRALKLDPDNARFHYQLARTYLEAGDNVAAQKEFAEMRRLQKYSLERQAQKLSGSASTSGSSHP